MKYLTVQNTQMYKVKLIDGKLVLTSSDIQVGDEIIWIGTGNSPQTPFGTKMKYDIPITSGKVHENWVKVIGEISPEAAKWIKEGQEFSEGEVRKLVELEIYHADWEPQFQDRSIYLKIEDSYTPKNEKVYHESITNEILQIKCPHCGTFQ